ncbi:MAG: PLP-dependent aminotransferase family protein, partial [Clostridia bacterium]|nr:PLP-dependent aminotransferase family protein [Clostridia bacterium]
MRYKTDAALSEPLYMQLYRSIKEDIVSGVLRPGEKLYSKRTLAAEAGVSVITVEHTYSLLSDEGYIISKEKSGFYVASDDGVIPSHGAYSIRANHAHYAGRYDFPLASCKRHMRAVIADYGDELLERAPNNGCVELRRAISDYLLRFRGISVSPERIVIGSGSEYLYSLLIQLFGKGATFAVEDPCYRKIEQVYTANGVRFVRLPLGGDGILPRALSSCRADVLHIMPYHSFP